jgi:hypothetical protein
MKEGRMGEGILGRKGISRLSMREGRMGEGILGRKGINRWSMREGIMGEGDKFAEQISLLNI